MAYMNDKKKTLRKEIIGFVLVGSIAFGVDFLTFNAAVISGLQPSTANLIAIGLATVLGFFGNSLFSFGHRFNSGLRAQMSLNYFLLTVISLVLSVVLTTLVLNSLSTDSHLIQNLGRTSVIAGLVILRFLGLKYFVYSAFTNRGEL
jgi:putative flippase GtrA